MPEPPDPRLRHLALIDAGRCACEGCEGTLTDPARSPGGWGHCRVCRCAWAGRVTPRVDQMRRPWHIPSVECRRGRTGDR